MLLGKTLRLLKLYLFNTYLIVLALQKFTHFDIFSNIQAVLYGGT